MSDNPTVHMFRCSTCGKWSHAKKQPKRHQRWVYEGDPEYDESKNENPGDGDPMYSAPNAHSVDCGPFVSYVAMPGR